MHICFAVYMGVCIVHGFLYVSMCMVCVLVVCAWCVCLLIWVSVCCEYACVVASQGTHEAHIHFGRCWSRQKLSSAEEEGVFPHLHATSPCFCLFFFSPTWRPFLHSVCLTGSSQPLIMAEIGLSFPSAPAPNTCSWALDRSCRIRMGKVSEEEGMQARQGLREGQRFSGSLIKSI